MHEIMALKENLMGELCEYARSPKLSVDDLMVVKALSSSVDHLCNILMAAEEEEGYSMRGGQGGGNYSREGNRYSREGGMGGNRYAYERGGNYSRRRGRNTRRDSMGRYTGRSGYYRADGVEELVESVRGMIQELPENLQQDAQRFVQQLEQEM